MAAGVGMAVVAAVGFGLFFVLLDRASATDVWWTVFFNRAASVALIAGVAIALRPPLRVGPARTAGLAAVGGTDIAANTLFAAAAAGGLTSVVGCWGRSTR